MISTTLLLLISVFATVHSSAVVPKETSRQVSFSVNLSGCVSLVKPFNRADGEGCACGNQCASNSCKENVCRCIFDKHCPGGEVCVTPPWGFNFCGASDLPVGALCFRNKQCGSSKCERGRCVCDDNGDCPDGQVCRRRLLRPNVCEEADVTSLALGAPCGKHSECETGRCEKDVCVCNDNGDCPAGQVCVRPIFNKNYCAPATLPLGAGCTKNSQCESNKCWRKKKCECNDNADCPAGKICKKRLIKINYCK